jgi:ABC-type dipeptide/oligopeptide/nickel transport system permease component
MRTGSLAWTVLRRLLLGLPTLAGVVIVSFGLTRLLPGDPAVYFAGAAPTPEAIADLRKVLLLDRPLWDQFAAYLGQLAHGNLGRSLVTGQPVLNDLSARFPATLELTLTAIALAVVVAVPLGVVGALHKGHVVDHACRTVSTAALSMPSFFTGLLLVFVFYYLLGLAPAPLGRIAPMGFPPPERTGFVLIDAILVRDWPGFRDGLAHLVLPALALAIAGFGPLTRITRGAMLAVLSSDFIRAARSYDMPRWRLVYVYALRNAMLPVLTTAGVVFSFLISANVVVEKVFSWPGVGSYALEALVASDYAAVQGFVLAVATLYVLINIAIDILYGIVDVRVRLAG